MDGEAVAETRRAYRDMPEDDERPNTLGAKCEALMATITDVEAVVERLGTKLEPVRMSRPSEVSAKGEQVQARSPIGDLLTDQTERVRSLGHRLRLYIDELDV